MERNLIIPAQVFLDSLVTPVVARARASFKLLHSYTDIRRTSYKTIPLNLSNLPSRVSIKRPGDFFVRVDDIFPDRYQ